MEDGQTGNEWISHSRLSLPRRIEILRESSFTFRVIIGCLARAKGTKANVNKS